MTTGIIAFNSNDVGYAFSTTNIKGTNGTNGKGSTGGTYDFTTGIIAFNSNDVGYMFSTTNIKGTNGTNGKGWTGGTYDSTTGIIAFASNDVGYAFSITNIKGTHGTNGKGWTGGTYSATTCKVSFASNDGVPYVFDTVDLRGGTGDNGKGWTGGTYDSVTGKVTFPSNDAGYALTTGDLRGASGATITTTQLSALMNTTQFVNNTTTNKFDIDVLWKPTTSGVPDAAVKLTSSKLIAGVGFDGTNTIDFPYFNLINTISVGSGLTISTGSAMISPQMTINLTETQIPSLPTSKITTGTFATAQIPSLDTGIITTGTLPVGRGGTGGTTFVAGQLLIGNTTSAFSQSTGLTWTTTTNLLTDTNLTITGVSTHMGTSIFTGNVGVGTHSVATNNNTGITLSGATRTGFLGSRLLCDLLPFKNLYGPNY